MNRYEKVIHKKVFNFEDICELTGNVNTAKSLIKAELEKKHIQKISIITTQISILIIFIAVWEITARKGIIDSFIMSQPSKILKTFINLSSNDLLMHIRSDMQRNFNWLFIRNRHRYCNCNNSLVV